MLFRSNFNTFLVVTNISLVYKKGSIEEMLIHLSTRVCDCDKQGNGFPHEIGAFLIPILSDQFPKFRLIHVFFQFLGTIEQDKAFSLGTR